MGKIYLLKHYHFISNGNQDIKLIGVFKDLNKAEEAIAVAKTKPGFSEVPDGFKIEEMPLNEIVMDKGELTT